VLAPGLGGPGLVRRPLLALMLVMTGTTLACIQTMVIMGMRVMMVVMVTLVVMLRQLLLLQQQVVAVV
jgi:hypothetical protein